MTLESVHRSAYLFAGVFAMVLPTMASGQRVWMLRSNRW